MKKTPKKTHLFRGILAAALFGMAGCSNYSDGSGGTASYYRYYFNSSYDYQTVAANFHDQPMQMHILGGPSNIAHDELAKQVIGAFDKRDAGALVSFSEHAEPKYAQRYRMIVSFNPPKDWLDDQVCLASDPHILAADLEPSVDGAAQRIAISYCRNERPLSALWVNMPAGNPVGSEGFQQTLALAGAYMLPLRDPFEGSVGGCKSC